VRRPGVRGCRGWRGVPAEGRRAPDDAVKGDQPKLFAQLRSLRWPQIPAADRTRNTGPGRRETRTVKAVTLHTPGIAFPHAQQAVRITRTRTTSTKTSYPEQILRLSLAHVDQAVIGSPAPIDARHGSPAAG
jgi:hypothetical protein